ncbi:ATP-binding protein [Methylosarcina fibrata]|uniref:ATP-binding protein n=1 Tax=Methylosarcina fibrata TaxID=105972 RepID=UPI0003781FE5|nr:ATP-binding protein [Methylosarcina fibrata]
MKISFRDASIRYKLMLIIGAASLLALLVVASAIIINEYITRKQETERNLSSLADMVSWNSSVALVFVDYQSAEQTLSMLRTQPEVVAAFLYKDEGAVFAEYKTSYRAVERLAGRQIIRLVKKEIASIEGMAPAPSLVSKVGGWYKSPFGLTANRPSEAPFSELTLYDRYGQLHLFHPILIDNEFVGVLHLVDDLSRLNTFLFQFYRIIGMIVLFTLFSTLLVSARLQRIFSTPVLELMQAMKAVAIEKKFTTRVEKTRNDEFGQLIDVYNDMLAEIRQRDEMLDKHRADLEFQVGARTAELSKKNEVLKLAVADALASKEEAEMANRAKSQFLANMSHEIRTPMNSVLGMIDFLSESDLTQEQRHSVEIVQQSAQLLLRVINDILDFSKIESGKFVLDYHPFDCNQMIGKSFYLFENQAKVKGLGYRLIHSELPACVEGDSLRLSQILVNLLSNAIKFTAQGEVTLRVSSHPILSESKVRLLFEVSDTGIGIEEDKQALIFDAFSQADGSMTRVFGGTGLGLAIARQLVTLMEGNIGVTSQPGKGATFWFWVELEKKAAVPAETHFVADCRFSARLLVAEDYPANQLLAKRALESLGCQVKIVNNGLEAVDELQREHYDLVFMDCQMPVMDGYQATMAIRRRESEERVRTPIPVIALTAHALAEDRAKCLAVGMDEWVTKPFTRQDLNGVLQKWLPERMMVGAEPSRSIAAPARNTVESSSQGSAIDLSFLLQNFNFDDPNDIEFMGHLKQVFQQNAEQTFKSLQLSIESNDADQVRKLAHSLKSISANVGAKELSSRCYMLEQAGQQNKLQNAEAILAGMHFEFYRVLTELNDIFVKQ